MLTVMVMYPDEAGKRFDTDYYLNKHMKLVEQRYGRYGLEGWQVLRGVSGGPDRPAPYRIMAVLNFRSAEDFQRAADAHGAELAADIPNFTDIAPVRQISEVIS